MHEKSVISTKSIPSFIILLPVISLVTVTLFVLLMINSIKKDLTQREIEQSKQKYEQALQSELKNSVTQAIAETSTLLDIELQEYKEQLPKKLHLFTEFFETAFKNQNNTFDTFLTNSVTNFNLNNPFFTIKILSSQELNTLLTPQMQKLFSKKKAYYLQKNLLLDQNFKQTIQYIKKLRHKTLLIRLNKEHFISNHARLVAQKLLKAHNYSENFNIFTIQKNHKLKPFPFTPSLNSPMLHTLQQKPDFIKETLKQRESGYFEKTTYKQKRGFIYAQAYTPLNWIIIQQTFIDEQLLLETIDRSTHHTYFDKKSEELLIIILIVSTIVLLLSLIVAKIINTVFSTFKLQIEEQNSALKNFNKALSHKVADKTRELQKSEERYRTIFESSPDSVIILENQQITYCNDSTLKMFQLNLKASIINKSITILLPEKQPNNMASMDIFNDYLDITMALGHSRFEFLLQKSTKKSFYADVWLQKLQLDDDKHAIYIVFRDIDFQKNAQEKIKEQHKEVIRLNETLEEKVKYEVEKNQEKEQILVHQSRLAQMGEMISMIAHQWRQPLNAISTASANLKLLIELDKYEQTKFTKTLTQIDDYIQHLSQTIDDFRNFFKPDKQKEETTIGDVINKSLNIIEKSFISHEISCQISIDQDVSLFTYPHELMQVILNILKNSEDMLLEREVPNKSITIRYEKTEQFHQLLFQDNAGGIPEDIIDQIFNPYFSTKHQKNGTGLGLYMSRVIINDHCKGMIQAENRDGGALFTISLPIE